MVGNDRHERWIVVGIFHLVTMVWCDTDDGLAVALKVRNVIVYNK